MGGKKKEKTTVTAAPAQTTPSFDPNAMLGPAMAMLEQQNQMTQAMIAQNAANQAQMFSNIPEPTVLDVVDYDAENKKLRAKLDEQVVESKRKGVLGTILTQLDNDDEPNTVKSLLSGTAK